MDKAVCRELAAVPASKLSPRLHKFLAEVVCDVFWTSDDQGKTVKDHVIQSKLTNPLQWLLFGGDPVVIAATFEGQSSTMNFCGKVFKNGEPAYFCKLVCINSRAEAKVIRLFKLPFLFFFFSLLLGII